MRHTLLHALMSLLTCTILFLLALRRVQSPSVEQTKCEDLMKYGRWSQSYSNNPRQAQWQPYGCRLQSYEESTIKRCLSTINLYFVGDSTIRQIFWAVAYKLGQEDAEDGRRSSPKHADLLYERNGTMLRYRRDPFLNKTETLDLLRTSNHANQAFQTDVTNPSNNGGGGKQDVVLMSTGLWHVRYLNSLFITEYQKTLETLAKVFSRNNVTADRAITIMVPPPVLNHAWLDHDRAPTLTDTRMSQLVYALHSAKNLPTMEVAWATRAMTENNTAALMSNGLHVTTDIAERQADIILNRICNNKIYGESNKASSLCCVTQKHSRSSGSILIAILVASKIICSLWMYLRRKQTSISLEIHAVLQFMLIVAYCWLGDRTTLFEKSDKISHENAFKGCVIVAAILGLLRVKLVHSPSTSLSSSPTVSRRLFQSNIQILTRSQTEEWKGWMQVYILLYHYFGMSKILWAYQIARVLVGSYIFLIGYGHATYFQRTSDLSIRRVLKALLRLNLLPCVFSVVMNNQYDFYYFPCLASWWFLVTFAIFRLGSRQDASTRVLVIRTVVAVCLVLGLLKQESLLSAVFSFSHMVYGPQINAKEWIFRAGLDVYSAFLGIAVSIVQHRHPEQSLVTHYLRYIHRRVKSCQTPLLLAVSCFLLWVYVLAARTSSDKFAYNKHHPLLSMLPITAYIIARNAHPTMRRYYSTMFATIGTYSLELFILQYHLWLASDTKGLLRLGLLDRVHTSSSQTVVSSPAYWLETFIITIIFFWLSKNCADATNTIVTWMVGEVKTCRCNKSHWRLPSFKMETPSESTAVKHCDQNRSIVTVSCLLGTLWLINIAYR